MREPFDAPPNVPSDAPLIEAIMPRFDAIERHAITIAASPAVVMRALWRADLVGPVARVLLGARALSGLLTGSRGWAELRPSRAVTLGDALERGFALIARGPHDVVLGVTGRFWEIDGCILTTDPATFADGPPAGTAQGAWSFTASGQPDAGTLLVTETRVLCADADARRRFKAYWLFVRPFSGLLRIMILRAVRRAAEDDRADD
jgi:hypothetical protein